MIIDKETKRIEKYEYKISKIKDAVISDNIEHIDAHAFLSCHELKGVYIPKSVKSIGIGAFVLCKSLKNVCYEGTPEEWAKIDITEPAFVRSINIIYAPFTLENLMKQGLSLAKANDVLRMKGGV